MASLPPLRTTSVDSEGYVGDKQVEELLSEKLLEGFTLLDTACPKCVTPLVVKKTSSMTLSPKRMQPVYKGSPPHMSMSYVNVQLQPTGSNIGAPSSSFEQPPAPVTDVPYCVSCKAHVVMKQSEIAILERTKSMNDRGSIIVAIEEDEREERNMASPRRLAEKNCFAERDSPEDGEAPSDKENDFEKDSRDESHCEGTVQEDVEMPEGEAMDDGSHVEEESPDRVESSSEDDIPAHVIQYTNVDEKKLTDVTKRNIDSPSMAVIQYTNVDEKKFTDVTKRNIVSPSMAAFLCASTASYQHVVPSPIATPKAYSYVEEEGIELELDDHSRYTEQISSEAANSVLLPPKPTGSDLLQEGEKEELDHVREIMSPRRQNAEDETQVMEGNDSMDEVLQEYSVRRDIATKVLGAKMLQGYSLMETQCLKCGMPLMEYSGQVDCVVCPVLVKKAKKRLKVLEEAKALHAKKAMIEAEIAARKKAEEEAATRAKVEQEALDAADIAEQESSEAYESKEQEGKETEDDVQEEYQEWEETKEPTEVSPSLAVSYDDVDSLISFGPAYDRATMYKPSFEETLRMEEEARLQEEERFLQEAFDDDQPSITDEEEKAAIDALRAAEDEERAAMEALRAAEEECLFTQTNASDAHLAEKALRSAEEVKQAAMSALEAAEEEERQAKKLLQAAEEHEQYAVKALQAAEEEEQIALEQLCIAEEQERLAVKHIDQVRDEERVLKDTLSIAEEEEKAALRLLRAAEDEEKAARAALFAAEEEERMAKEALQAEEKRRKAREALEQAEAEEHHALEVLRAEEKKIKTETEAEKLARLKEAETARLAEIERARMARLAEIEEAEKARREAEEEAQCLAEEKEAQLLERLEREAKEKTRAAEKAMLKAQAALNQVAAVRKQMYAKTIAQAEVEAIAEAEAIVKSEAEDFKELAPSKSFMDRERWETLRIEGRALMTRRILQGWRIEKSSCKGVECNNMSLISLNGKKIECTVCGGSGSGIDGAYQVEIVDYDETEDTTPDIFNNIQGDDVDASASINSMPTDCRAEEIPPKTHSSAIDDDVVTSPSNQDVSVGNGTSKVEAPADASASGSNPMADDTPTVEVADSVSFHDGKESEAPKYNGPEDWGINDSTRAEDEAIDNGFADVDGVSKHNGSESISESSYESDDEYNASGSSSTASQSSEDKDSSADSGNDNIIASISHHHREVIGSPCSPTRFPHTADVGPSFDECPVSPTKSATRSVTELKEDFESKKNFVSKEIGRRMMKGWMLLDMSCPECLMPLLSDPQIGQATCVLCGPTAKLPNVISTVARHDPPVDPPTYDEDEDEENAANPLSAISPSNSGLATKASDLSQKKTELEKEKPSAELLSNDGSGNIPLQLPAGFDMTDEAALRKLIALVKSGQMTAEDGPTTESSMGTAVITTSLDNDDVSRINGVTMNTPINEANRRPPSGHGKVNVPEIVEEEAGVEIMRMDSSRESFDETSGDASPASPMKGAFFAEDKSTCSHHSAAHKHEETASYKNLTTDDQSASSRHSAAHDVPVASSYKSLTVEDEMEYYKEFNLGQPVVQREHRVSPMPSPLNKSPPARPAFRPLTPTSPSPAKRSTLRGPPRPEDFGNKPSIPPSPASSGDVRPHSMTSYGQTKYRRVPPPFSGPSPRREVPYDVGGYHQGRSRFDDDSSIRSERSHAGSTVASQAYESLMIRIEECKRNLIESDDPEYQARQAALLEKLGAAAVSMRRLEESG